MLYSDKTIPMKVTSVKAITDFQLSTICLLVAPLLGHTSFLVSQLSAPTHLSLWVHTALGSAVLCARCSASGLSTACVLGWKALPLVDEVLYSLAVFKFKCYSLEKVSLKLTFQQLHSPCPKALSTHTSLMAVCHPCGVLIFYYAHGISVLQSLPFCTCENVTFPSLFPYPWIRPDIQQALECMTQEVQAKQV